MHNYQNPAYAATLGRQATPRRVALALAPSARLALGLILLLAFGLRLWGLAFGLPYIIQPDEPSVENRAINMWLTGNFDPGYFTYPSLVYDLQALLAWAVGHVGAFANPDILRHPFLHTSVYYLAGRTLTAVLGLCTVFVTYLAGRAIGPRVGLLAALFLAVAPQHIQQSHYITVDAPTALFTALAALFALRLARDGGAGMRLAALGGVAAGLAAGTKYNAGVALVLPLAAALWRTAWSWPQRLRACALAACACLVAFLVTTPFAIFDRPLFIQGLRGITEHYSSGHPGAEGNDNAIWYLLYLGQNGLLFPITVLALAGMAVALIRHRRPGVLLLLFTLPYYALLCSTYVRFDRNLLPLLPFVTLFAAIAGAEIVPHLARLLRNGTAALALVVAIAALPPAYVSARADVALTHPFTEQVAVDWATAHLPDRATLATENWEGHPFELSPRHFRITHLSTSLTLHPYDWFLAHGIRYAAADSYTDGAYLRAPRLYPLEVARYRELFRRARLLFRVPGDTPRHSGPTMSIYELRP